MKPSSLSVPAIKIFIYVIKLSGVMHWALRTTETRCDDVGMPVNLDKTGLVVFTRRRKPPRFFEPHFLGLLYVALCLSSISSIPGFSADLEGICGYQGKENI